MEYCSAIKVNQLLNHRKTRRNLKCLLLSERSQSEKAKYCVIVNIWHLEFQGKTIEIVKDQWLPGAWG